MVAVAELSAAPQIRLAERPPNLGSSLVTQVCGASGRDLIVCSKHVRSRTWPPMRERLARSLPLECVDTNIRSHLQRAHVRSHVFFMRATDEVELRPENDRRGQSAATVHLCTRTVATTADDAHADLLGRLLCILDGIEDSQGRKMPRSGHWIPDQR